MAGVNIPLLPNELARKDGGRFQLRPGPTRLAWSFEELVSADGHEVRCDFTCSVTVLNEPAELKMLEEVFLGRTSSLKSDAVVAHFAPGLRAAAARVAGKLGAQALVDQDAAARQQMIDALREEGKKIAFSSGLELVSPFEVHFESATFAAQRIEEMERTLAQRRIAGQVEHFEKAAGLLKTFDELRKSNPELSPADVLKLISPSDQGTMLQTLLLASGRGDTARPLWAVAGNSALRIDPRVSPAGIEARSLPEALGPLRSIQPARLNGKDVLLVGARSGVIVLDAADGSTILLPDRSMEFQLGFSAAVVWNEQVWACHGEAGVVGWSIGMPERPLMELRPSQLRSAENPPPLPTQPSPPISVTAGGVLASMAVRTAGIRNVTALDEKRLVFSVGHEMVVLDARGDRSQFALQSHAEVLAIVPDAKRVLLAQEDGTVSVLDRATLEVLSTQKRAGRLSAAGRLPWLGAGRLLLASEEGPVYCVGPDDEVVTQYMSNHRGLRTICAAADLVAGVSSDRQRVVVWNSWDGKKPVAEIAVSAATRHRVGDIEFA